VDRAGLYIHCRSEITLLVSVGIGHLSDNNSNRNIGTSGLMVGFFLTCRRFCDGQKKKRRSNIVFGTELLHSWFKKAAHSGLNGP
jgi:hypothetical protein